MKDRVIMAVDVGAGSARAGLFDPGGQMLARAEAGVAAEAVEGIGFDATCSLVALDQTDGPASVSTDGERRWSNVVWLDHRAGALPFPGLCA